MCVEGGVVRLCLVVVQHQRQQQPERAMSELYDGGGAAGGGDRGPLAVFNLERVGIQQVDFGWRLGRYLSSSSLTGFGRLHAAEPAVACVRRS